MGLETGSLGESRLAAGRGEQEQDRVGLRSKVGADEDECGA